MSSQPLRVLVVEDSAEDALLLERELRGGGFELAQLLRVEDAAAFTAALDAQAWDAVISDYSLPRFSALAALAIFRRRELDIPFIVVSGTVGEDTAVETMKAGADDYLLKGNLVRLTPAIQRELREAARRRAWRRAEKQLAESVSLLTATLEATADAMIAIDEDHDRIAVWNHKFIELWGLTREEMGQLREDRNALIARMQALVNDPAFFLRRRDEIYHDQPSISLDEIPLKDGRIIAIYSFPQMVNQRQIGRVWSFRDVTRRRHLEKDLRASERRYRLLFERNLAGVVQTTPEGELLDCNPAFMHMLGFDSIEELQALPTRQYYAQPGEREVLLAQLRARGSVLNYETQLQGRDGRLVAVLESATLVRDEDDGREVIEKTLIDITEYARVREDLRQAQKLNALGQLAGGIAHDFNNLLTVILGNAGMLAASDQIAPAVQRQALAIQGAGERAAAMTKQLLMFSRKQSVAVRALDLNQVTQDMKDLLFRLLPTENLKLVIQPAPGEAKINGDLSQLEQVLLNLVVNARDAMPDGGQLSLSISATTLGADVAGRHPLLAPGSYVLLEISDTGKGMDEETQRHIFEPFFTTKGEGRGTGLGLATVYGIVSQMGGHVRVTSALGKGTTFQLYFPAAD